MCVWFFFFYLNVHSIFSFPHPSPQKQPPPPSSAASASSSQEEEEEERALEGGALRLTFGADEAQGRTHGLAEFIAQVKKRIFCFHVYVCVRGGKQ